MRRPGSTSNWTRVRAMQLAPQQYELILLDTVLDAMDGLQLLQLIKHQAPASKFIIVSDSADETSRAVAYQNGADFFLERPRTPEAFALALEAIRGLFKPAAVDEPLQDEADAPVVSIADIVQMRCLSGDSVLLLVRSQYQSGDIFIFRGEIFHAQYPGKSGEAAFRDMIHWNGGLVRIKAVKLTHTPPRTIEIPYRQLLETVEKSGAQGPDIDPDRRGALRCLRRDAARHGGFERHAGGPAPGRCRARLFPRPEPFDRRGDAASPASIPIGRST